MSICSEKKEHHKDAEWLKDVKKELEQDEGQHKINIPKDKMMRVMRKILNWKALGPDNVQGYWLRNITPLHDKLVVCLQDCLDSLIGWPEDKQSIYKRIIPSGILQAICDLLQAYP